MTTPTYEQQAPSDGKLLTEDNHILDLQGFMESGAIIATVVSSATPVTPIGEATIPTYEQITPQAKKFINSLNEVYDLLAFLQSGNLKVQVTGGSGAPTTASYITQTDATAALPNSQPLSALSNGFMSVTTASGVVNSRVLTQTANQIDITNADGLAGNPTFALSSTLITPGSLQVGTTFNIAGTVSVDTITSSASSVSPTALMTAPAVHSAISAAIVSGKSFRGGWDASVGSYPTSGGSGSAGVIIMGDWWYITVAGTMGSNSVQPGDQVFALQDYPGQTDANWLVIIEKVDSVFGRQGDVVAMAGDYNFNQISGTAAVSQGGTGLTSPGSAGNVLTSNGTDWISAAPSFKSYGVFVPFLANKVISGPDWASVPFGTDTAKGICPGGISAAQFVYHYFLYLKVGVTYRFSFSALKFNSCGILQFAVKSADQSVTYNTLSNVDLYSASAGVVSVNKQTFTFSPAGFNAGDWVECTFVYFCSSKNASSSSYFAPVIDGNAGFSFYEKYS